jgi:hypothetical protein
VSVDPLGEAPAPRVLPDGFRTLLEPVAAPVVRLVPVVLPVVLPLTDEPAVAPVAGPPTEAPPPAEAPPDMPLLCANAKVLDNANALASAMVLSFMKFPHGLMTPHQLGTGGLSSGG